LRISLLSGVTASGKSQLAVKAAQERGGVVFSCDSLLVYRGMNIGTAKPSLEEQGGVPHFLMDLVDPREHFSVGDYLREAQRQLEIVEREKVPEVVVCGGSGFYLLAWLKAVTDEIPVDREIRERVASWFSEGGIDRLRDEIQRRDPHARQFLDWDNPRRLSPALERMLATGWSLKDLRNHFMAQKSPLARFPMRCLRLDWEDNELQARIRARTRQMIANGLVDEVKKLMALGITDNPSAASAIGYREVIALLKDRQSPDEANLSEEISCHTLQLVKKQRKWFRKYFPFPPWEPSYPLGISDDWPWSIVEA